MFPFQFLNLFFVTTKDKEKEHKYDMSVYKRGDLLAAPRTIFTHFGIYLGDNKVAHLIPDILPALSKNQNAIKKTVTNHRLILGVLAKVASIRVDSVEDFAYGAEITVNQMDKVCSQLPLNSEEVARRAEKLLGSITYSILWHNCEHYVMYCRYGTATSFQTTQGSATLVLGSHVQALLIFVFTLNSENQKKVRPNEPGKFCNAVRATIFSKWSAFLTAILGLGTMLYLGSVSAYTILATLLLSFGLWIAS